MTLKFKNIRIYDQTDEREHDFGAGIGVKQFSNYALTPHNDAFFIRHHRR